jgi:hypothetical protein
MKTGCGQRVYKSSRYCINHNESAQKRKAKALKRKQAKTDKSLSDSMEDGFWNS